MHGGRESILGVVRERDRLLFSLEWDNHENGAEDLLGGDTGL